MPMPTAGRAGLFPKRGTVLQVKVRQVLTEYQHHYNGHRAHRARDQRPPEANDQPAPTHTPNDRRLLRIRIVGGTINEYRYAA